MPGFQIPPYAHGGVLHAERPEQIIRQDLPVGALRRIEATHRFAHQGVIDHRRVIDTAAGLFERMGHLADCADDLIQSIDVHARARTVDARNPGAVGQQMEI